MSRIVTPRTGLRCTFCPEWVFADGLSRSPHRHATMLLGADWQERYGIAQEREVRV